MADRGGSQRLASMIGATCSKTSNGTQRETEAEDLGGEEEREERRRTPRRIEARAEAILDTLEETFRTGSSPTACRHPKTSVRHARGSSSARRTTIFSAARSARGSRTDPGLVEGLDDSEAEAAIEEVEAVERVSRVTEAPTKWRCWSGPECVAPRASASMPQRQFIDVYAEALGGRAQAARVHAQAQQTAAASKLVGAPPDAGAAARAVRPRRRAGAGCIKNVPDAQTLFQAAGGFCDCEHCGSVYSPAAYFVDLLRYLNVSSPNGSKDREALAEQEPASPRPSAALKLQFQPLDVLPRPPSRPRRSSRSRARTR